ncbi:MAG: helix-turn-helix domain-containing protein [Lachnospiraceae bacterium]|nr:helix-turn-helix domain-containing protein [Lachnospiraceae bacterium]
MEIGKKLKSTRLQKGFTQEAVAEKIQVSRQTISNWENEKSYPDIVSVVNLSNLYEISLDELLKEDKRMLEHLEESTNMVKSNKRLVVAVIINIVLLLALVLLSSIVPNKVVFLVVVFVLAIISFSLLLYQIIKRL